MSYSLSHILFIIFFWSANFFCGFILGGKFMYEQLKKRGMIKNNLDLYEVETK